MRQLKPQANATNTVRVLMFVFLLFNSFNADEPKKAIHKLLNVFDILKK